MSRSDVSARWTEVWCSHFIPDRSLLGQAENYLGSPCVGWWLMPSQVGSLAIVIAMVSPPRELSTQVLQSSMFANNGFPLQKVKQCQWKRVDPRSSGRSTHSTQSTSRNNRMPHSKYVPSHHSTTESVPSESLKKEAHKDAQLEQEVHKDA